MAECRAEKHGSSWWGRGCRCPEARAAQALSQKKWRLRRMHFGGPTTVPALGTQRRLQALCADGWTWLQIGEQLGHNRAYAVQGYLEAARVRHETHQRVKALYDRLELEGGPSTVTTIRSKRKGWAPPEAWFGVDMDDPAAGPRPTVVVVIDEVAVERLMTGTLRAAEVHEAEVESAVRRLYADGVSAKNTVTLLDCDPVVVERYRRRVTRGK